MWPNANAIRKCCACNRIDCLLIHSHRHQYTYECASTLALTYAANKKEKMKHRRMKIKRQNRKKISIRNVNEIKNKKNAYIEVQWGTKTVSIRLQMALVVFNILEWRKTVETNEEDHSELIKVMQYHPHYWYSVVHLVVEFFRYCFFDGS